jgi:hypothetical protein
MNTRTNGTRNSMSIIGALMVIFFSCGGPSAQEHFDKLVPGDTAADFITLVTFPTPTGAGANQKTIARIVTPIPTDSVMFEIRPPTVTGKTPVEVSIGGPTKIINVGATPVANVVKADLISIADDFAVIRITIAYHPAFDFGGTAETWSLKVLELATERRYIGFVTTGEDDPGTIEDEVDQSVTRPRIHITENELNFGEVLAGVTSNIAPVRPVTIRNVGTAVLSVNPLPSTSLPFSVVSPTAPFTVAPNAPPVTVTVRFIPTTVGAQSGELRITSNDPDTATVAVALQGVGVAPRIEVVPDRLTFGNVTVGQSAAQNLMVRNVGTAVLSVSPLPSTTAPFSVVSPTAPFTVAPNAPPVTVTVRFSPTAVGGQSGELRITSNDPDRATVAVPLQGAGTTPRPCPPGQKCCECCELDSGCPALCVPIGAQCSDPGCADECGISHDDCVAAAANDPREIRICIAILRACLRACR